MGCGTIDNINKNITQNKYFDTKNFYKDKLFPPSDISIFGKENLEKINSGKKIRFCKYYKGLIKDFKQKHIIWKRARDIFNNEKYLLFSKNISPKNIIQGSIGNCYFLTIVSGLTKFPSLIYQLFNYLSVTENCFYELYLNINNKISKIYLDDYFPYNIRKNKLVFCKSFNNEIWLMLLEKAWAKIKGSYYNMDNGSPFDVLKSLLLSSNSKEDFSYDFHSLNDDNKKNKIWDIMVNNVNKNDNSFMICLSKGNLKNKKKLNNLNYSIVENHFYNIINVFEEEGKKFLLIRNPWGFNLKNKNYYKNKNDLEFIIDNSEEYIEEKEKEDNLSSLEEGEFIIDFNYFCYLFEEIQIYEIKKFSFNIICNSNKENNSINIVYLGMKNKKINEIKLKLKIFFDEKTDSIIDQFIYLNLLIIRKDRMEIYNKMNYKIHLNKLKKEFSLPFNPDFSINYYLCFFFSYNISKMNNFDINIIFQSDNYLDVINYKQYYDNKDLLEIIKREFEGSQFNLASLKFKENIFD